MKKIHFHGLHWKRSSCIIVLNLIYPYLGYALVHNCWRTCLAPLYTLACKRRSAGLRSRNGKRLLIRYSARYFPGNVPFFTGMEKLLIFLTVLFRLQKARHVTTRRFLITMIVFWGCSFIVNQQKKVCGTC